MKKHSRRNPTKHHLLAKCRGGTDDEDNILILPREQHEAYHKLFNNRTIDEAISFLKELKQRREAVFEGQ